MRRLAARCAPGRARAMPAGSFACISRSSPARLVVLAVFFFVASLIGKGARVAPTCLSGCGLVVRCQWHYGVARAGIPLLNELGAFIPIFAFRC